MNRLLFKIRLELIFLLASMTLIWIITLSCGNITVKKSDKDFYVMEAASTKVKSGIQDDPGTLSAVGFVSMKKEPNDEELKKMIDDAVSQILGPDGLSTIIKKGYKVIIKVNNVCPYAGKNGEKGRGVITDPRIVRYMAEKIRNITGFEGTADLKVVDACYSADKNPSERENKQSFYWSRLERDHGGNVGYDENGDGFLDGQSKAQLVNLDSVDFNHRYLVQIKDYNNNCINVWMPKFMRTKEQALKSGTDINEYCDVLIGIPIFKSHGLAGITGALKLHYGFRPFQKSEGDTGRWGHSGLYWDVTGIHKKENLLDYLCAQHIVREYDFILMDCLTGNRRGPTNPNGGITSINYDEPVDYILTHALLSSKDPVAMDTVETLLAGYDPDSIRLLETGYRFGLGNNNPGYILIEGLTNFMEHKNFLFNTYAQKNKYPFQDGWGDARILNMNGLFNPVNGSFRINTSEPIKIKDNSYSFKYSLEGDAAPGIKPVRADLLINGRIIACRNSNPGTSGEISADLRLLPGIILKYRIVLWDRALDCILSDEKDLCR